MSIICFENVYYKYPRCGKFALEGINLTVTQGEFLAVMGENGAGKTTFCRLINGILPHSLGGILSGAVIIDGRRTDETTVAHLALKAGMVFDDPDAQLFTSTVRQEAAFGPENLLLPPQEIEERVKNALACAGLTGFEDRRTATLSGGEKQRLAIAAAMSMKGKILVLDEPLSRLDGQGAAELMSVLKNIQEKFQITVIMASHESNLMAANADRVCILKNGRITAIDTAQNIFASRSLLDDNGLQPLSGNNADLRLLNARNTGEHRVIDIKTGESLRAASRENSPSMPPAIEIKNFKFSYGTRTCIENFNLSIMDNDFTAITGNNGCGKTTLLKCITGLLRPGVSVSIQGDIYIRGANTKDLTVSAISREIGFVMQNQDSQLFTDSVYSEVSFALKNLKLSKMEIRRRVEDALHITGLEDKDAFPHALNRAKRTMTVLASVIAMGCKTIILDEIDVGQDYLGSLKIMNIARELHSRGFTIIFVTHNMSLVREYGHRVVIMRSAVKKDNT